MLKHRLSYCRAGLQRLSLLIVAVILIALCSCERRPLLYDEVSDTYPVQLVFDWSDITDHELPTAMRVLFYPLDDKSRTEPYIFDIAGNKGGTVQLPAGRYEVVSYNHNTDNILVSNMDSIVRLSATTQQLSGKSRGVNIPDSLLPKGQSLYDSPQWFCRAYKKEVAVAKQRLTEQEDTRAEDASTRAEDASTRAEDASTRADDATTTVTLTPEWAVYKVTFEIRGISGLRYVNQAEGYFTGMSSSLNIAANEASEDSSAVLFQPSVSEKDSVIKGSLYYWGIPKVGKQMFHIFIWGQSGTYKGTTDVTADFANTSGEHSHNHEIDIVVKMDIAFTPGKGGGFDPTVPDYNEEYHDIPIK